MTKPNIVIPYIRATRCQRPLKFKTMDSVRSNGLRFKYLRFKSSDCKDKGIKRLEFVTKAHSKYSILSFIVQQKTFVLMNEYLIKTKRIDETLSLCIMTIHE